MDMAGLRRRAILHPTVLHPRRNAMRKRFFRLLLLLSGAVALSVAPALAQGRSQDHGHGHGQDKWEKKDHGHGKKSHGHVHDRVRFRDHDRGVIVSYYRGYYRDHGHHLPPGLAKREHLPPGLARQLRRNGHLPPGLQKRVVWFPKHLDRQLGPLPYGYRRCWVGDNVLIVNPKTFAILDIIRDVAILAH
jgi:hypothetical protein